jgi:BASS family bile acid:Na+ symporter
MTRWRWPDFHGFGFTLAVALAVAISMTWPSLFSRWGTFETKALIVPLIQVIMFGMGTTLSMGDFARVLSMPWPVFVGMVLQFMVMPVVGWAVATMFGFEPLIAAPSKPLVMPFTRATLSYEYVRLCLVGALIRVGRP